MAGPLTALAAFTASLRLIARLAAGTATSGAGVDAIGLPDGIGCERGSVIECPVTGPGKGEASIGGVVAASP